MPRQESYVPSLEIIFSLCKNTESARYTSLFPCERIFNSDFSLTFAETTSHSYHIDINIIEI